jgi:nicotinate-nucleotide adenylyltransferase
VRHAIFGGSFDPPHIGHLLVAQDACDHLALDRLILVPAATQPLKAGRASASAEHRLAMVRELAADDRRLEVSPMEVERGGLSFTVDTLSAVAKAHPSAELYLLVGADVLETFQQWREPERIRSLARLAVFQRGEAPADADRSWRDRVGVVWLPNRRIDVSSTEIRERVRKGKSIRGFVTDAVAAYIARAGLYREG